jgi:hypothetical protein
MHVLGNYELNPRHSRNTNCEEVLSMISKNDYIKLEDITFKN